MTGRCRRVGTLRVEILGEHSARAKGDKLYLDGVRIQ